MNNKINQTELLELKKIGKNFHLFAICFSSVTHWYKGIGLVGGGKIFKDERLSSLLDVDKSEITEGFLKLQEQGYIVTSKIFPDKRAIAVIGFDKFFHKVDYLEEYQDRFDEIFGELNHNVLFSLWDVEKIKNPRWYYAYLEIHRHMALGNGITFDEFR